MLPQVPVLSNQEIQPTVLIIEQEQPKPVLYKVVANDNLTRIAEAHQTTVQRLWEANTSLADPNHLEINQELIVPLNTDVLPEREMPSTIQSTVLSMHTVQSPPSGGFSSSGNLYSPGFCTYGVKMWRPDLPNNLGDAYQWFSNAAKDGLPTGFVPRVGAVAVAAGYSHVALVIGVGDGTVTVREMNYGGLWNINERVTPTSEWQGYIL